MIAGPPISTWPTMAAVVGEVPKTAIADREVDGESQGGPAALAGLFDHDLVAVKIETVEDSSPQDTSRTG